MGEVIRARELKQRRRRADLEQKIGKIPEQYIGDIKKFRAFCAETGEPEDMEAMLEYLDWSMNEQKVKKSTWNRRLAAIKKYLTVERGEEYTEEIRDEIRKYRAAFNLDEHREQIRMKGQPAGDAGEIFRAIYKETEGDSRRRAIALVNLVTGNRPSEMVRLQVQHFDLVNAKVHVYLKKQREWREKMLTPETVDAVRAYIREYGLKQDDYFVGAVDRWGNRENRVISTPSYHKLVRRLLDFAPYTFRKTLVSTMNANGADIGTIMKQTGHKSTETVIKHYLEVADGTVGKYLPSLNASTGENGMNPSKSEPLPEAE